MKLLSLSIVMLFTSLSFAMSEGRPGPHREATKGLVNEVVSTYSKNFQKSIKAYNSRRSHIGALSKAIKNDTKRKQFLSYTSQHGIKVFPKIIYKDGAAKIKLGKNLIKFSVGTLFDRYILVNGIRVPLDSGDFYKQLDSLKKNLGAKKKFSMFNLFIGEAVAAYDKRFENTLFGTIIILNETFEENSWCYFCEDEYHEATKKNFEKVMADISTRANNCKSGEDEGDYFGYQLEELGTYASAGYDLREKLNSYFKSYTDENLNCESMVNNLYKEEIKGLKGKIGFYSDSISIRNKRESNKQAYQNYIKNKCTPYVELRNCLIDKSYAAKGIYNKERKSDGKKSIRSSDSLNKEYRPSSTTR